MVDFGLSVTCLLQVDLSGKLREIDETLGQSWSIAALGQHAKTSLSVIASCGLLLQQAHGVAAALERSSRPRQHSHIDHASEITAHASSMRCLQVERQSSFGGPAEIPRCSLDTVAA